MPHISYVHTFDSLLTPPRRGVRGRAPVRRIASMFTTGGGEVRIDDPNVAQSQASVDHVAENRPGVISQRGSAEVSRVTR
ncbi:hypothetical protein GCM10023147_01860 [Tsukamurella soli]|uniref:Uncharacterized protein n=1 Tax=Tsukamurella soli TaxID=644556 RepID=A0ABP8J139_9ACTN